MARHITLQGALLFSALNATLLCRLTLFNLRSSISISFSIGVAIWLIYRTFIYPFYFSPLRHIPTVPGCPLWGHAPARLTSEIGVPERQWHIKYGLIVRYFLPFGVERLAVADDEAIKEITIRRPYDFIKSPMATQWMKGILGERGVLLAEGDLHAKIRKALAPAFSTSAIRDLEPKFWEKGFLLTELLSAQLTEDGRGEPIEMLEWLNRATLDVISSGGFGYEIDSLNNPDTALRQAYSAIFAFDLPSCIAQGLRLYLPILNNLPFRMNKTMESTSKIVTEHANDVVNAKYDKSETDSSRKDIISLIIRHNNTQPPPERLSFEDIRDQVKTFLGAGHDTTATAVGWTIHLLSKNPKIQSRLREEILSAIPDLSFPSSSTPSPQSLADANVWNKLPYLNNICRESLRFIPPIPIVIRVSATDTSLAGYEIRKGMSIYITSNAINNLPHYWGPTAGIFDPDRWEDLPKETWVANAFQTFLEGPRGCVGRKFAEMEMRVFVCCLVARFVFERDEGWADQEERKMWRIVLRPRDGVRVRVKKV